MGTTDRQRRQALLPFVFGLLVVWLLLPIGARASGSSAHERARTIVIDPGHGGERTGAIGPGGKKEKDIALAISLALATRLEERGHRVILTRRDDVSLGLEARVALANEKGADLFLSIHANSMPTAEARARTHGVETYFLSARASDDAAAALAHQENADAGTGSEEAPADPLREILADLARSEAHVHSSRLAYEIQESLAVGLGAKNRGVKQAPFVVLQGATMPAVLVEVGYLSHPREGRRLADPAHQSRIATFLALGVDAFLDRILGKQEATRVEGARLEVPPLRRIE